jgi:hypothetical protein
MAVNLFKPVPDDESAGAVLHLVEGEMDAEGADESSRLRAFVDTALERIEDEGAWVSDGTPAFAVPRVSVRRAWGAVGYAARCMRAGTVVIVGWLRHRKIKKGGGEAPATGAKGKARKINGGSAVGLLGFGAIGVLMVKNNMPLVATAGQWTLAILMIVWIPAAVTIGAFHVPYEPTGDTPEEPTDHAETDPSDEEEEPISEAPEAATLRVWEWVRGHIGEYPGVHLQTLLDDLHQHPESGIVTIPDLQRYLTAHGIPWKAQQKAPDWAKNGKITNRAGVPRTAVETNYTPIPDPGTNHVRLLHPYQPSDLQ